MQAALLHRAVVGDSRLSWAAIAAGILFLLLGTAFGAFAFPRSKVQVQTKVVRVPVEVPVAQPAPPPEVKVIPQVQVVERVRYVRVRVPAPAPKREATPPSGASVPTASPPPVVTGGPEETLLVEQPPKQVEVDPGVIIPLEPGQTLTYDIGWRVPEQAPTGSHESRGG